MLLKELSYYKTGGTLEKLYAPASIEELSKVMKDIHSQGIPFFLLGAGSNSLVMDDHWPGAVVIFSKLSKTSIEGKKIVAQAGLDNTRFSEICWESGLTGASWMNWLPGQIGSTVRMNARCYGGEISQIVESVTSVSRQGEIKTYPASEMFFGYKDTVFMNNADVVAEVTFSLDQGNQDKIREQMDFCKSDRDQKHQFLHPSCGCVFKNDYEVGIPSGLLLDSAGVRQLSNELVEISPYHANFVFNKGASARDILMTSLEMRELTYAKFGVWLKFEMELLGMVPEDLKTRVSKIKPSKYNQKELEILRRKFQG